MNQNITSAVERGTAGSKAAAMAGAGGRSYGIRRIAPDLTSTPQTK